jgi:DNA-binding IclR family transcriptional regulator
MNGLTKEDDTKKMQQNEEPLKTKTQLKSLNRALHVLEYIAEHSGRAVDICEGLKISWATLHRTLQQLEQDGFLSKDPETNRYRVGPRAWFIGSTYLAIHPVLEPARPYLDRASLNSSITVQLVERSKKQATVLYNSHSENSVTRAAVGYHFPLHAGSKGQVLLAYAPNQFIEDYVSGDLTKLTKTTEIDAKSLLKRLKKIRNDGYACTIGDVQVFSGSIAAPIFNRDNNVVACVCFVTKKSILQNITKLDILVEQLIETTQNISISLGWHPNSIQP